VDPGRRIQDTEEKTDALEKYFAEELQGELGLGRAKTT
jgi:hypothetical protein